jgi:hypothetical protein
MDRNNRYIPRVIESEESLVRRTRGRRFDFSPRQALHYNDQGNPVPENREASALTRRKYDGVEHLGQRGHLTFTQRQLQFSQHRQESRTYHWDGGDYHRPVTVTGDVFTYKFADIEAADSAGWDLLLLTKDHETVRFRCRNRAQAQEVAGLVNARI